MEIRRIAKRVANRYLYAKDECSGIKDIHKYVKCRAEKLKENGCDNLSDIVRARDIRLST